MRHPEEGAAFFEPMTPELSGLGAMVPPRPMGLQRGLLTSGFAVPMGAAEPAPDAQDCVVCKENAKYAVWALVIGAASGFVFWRSR